jgi:hypothetical protein
MLCRRRSRWGHTRATGSPGRGGMSLGTVGGGLGSGN